MTQKALDGQIITFCAKVLECLPPEITNDVMQGWIENPHALQKVLKQALMPKTLKVDYSINPSFIALKIESHSDREDIFELDTTKLKRLQPLEKGEFISGHKYLERLKAKWRASP